MNTKKAVLVYLPDELLKRVKHFGVDSEQTVSGITETALEEYLQLRIED